MAGRYDLHTELGHGGSGPVWTAWDRCERRWVAAKLLRDDALVTAVHEQSLRIDHPHLLAPLAWVAEDDAAVIVTPLATGGSLRDQLACGVVPGAGVVLDLLDQVLAGLVALHERGWVHRDVTPANLLLDAGTAWRVRVADLGVAARIGAPVAAGSAPGTDGYLAPEALAGAPVDPRQDLYAVGVLGLLLLRAAQDRAGSTATDTDTDDDCRWARAVLARMADPDPGRRPGCAAEARSLLRDAAAAVPTGERPPVPRRATTPPPAGELAAASACFIAAIAVAATVLMRVLG